jgi:hypothetical protein
LGKKKYTPLEFVRIRKERVWKNDVCKCMKTRSNFCSRFALSESIGSWSGIGEEKQILHFVPFVSQGKREAI